MTVTLLLGWICYHNIEGSNADFWVHVWYGQGLEYQIVGIGNCGIKLWDRIPVDVQYSSIKMKLKIKLKGLNLL